MSRLFPPYTIQYDVTQVGKKSDLQYEAPIPDPDSGLFAPLLAVTIHPGTNELLPVSGTYLHSVTGLRCLSTAYFVKHFEIFVVVLTKQRS